MKLGLDKAVLQRMDANSAMGNESSSGAPSALSKQEVENLLKKGAYAAFLDDSDSQKFCEEDIDEILERRTRVIKHSAEGAKGSIFSKASFASGDTDKNLEMDDPLFWDKVAQMAELNIEEPMEEADLLLQLEPRLRKQVHKFGDDEVEGGAYDDNSDEEYGNLADGATKRNAPRDFKIWTPTEKARFERAIMLYGFSSWDKTLRISSLTLDAFARRSEQDLEAVGRQLMRYCLRNNVLEPDLVRDIKNVLGIDPGDVPEESPCKSVEVPDAPYPDATQKQIKEYRSYLIESPPEYREHIDRKGKALLTRIQLVF